MGRFKIKRKKKWGNWEYLGMDEEEVYVGKPTGRKIEQPCEECGGTSLEEWTGTDDLGTWFDLYCRGCGWHNTHLEGEESTAEKKVQEDAERILTENTNPAHTEKRGG